MSQVRAISELHNLIFEMFCVTTLTDDSGEIQTIYCPASQVWQWRQVLFNKIIRDLESIDHLCINPITYEEKLRVPPGGVYGYI